MPVTGENANLSALAIEAILASHQRFPNAFEVLGSWEDPATLRYKVWIMFFCTAAEGKQAGLDTFGRAVFDSLDFVMLSWPAWRPWVVARPRGELTRDDHQRMNEILHARTRRNLEASFFSTEAPSEENTRIAPKNSFRQVPIENLLIDDGSEF
jgi:hypothetical protein